MMKTSLRIVLRSWQLPWREKQLLILPVLLFVALYTSEYLAKILGLELDPNDRNAVPRFILFVLYHMATDAIFYTFLAALSVAIALRVLNEHDVNLNQILSDLRQRAGSLLALAFLIEIFSSLSTFGVFFLPSPQPPFRWDLYTTYELLSVCYLLLVKVVFLLALPTLVNEKGRFHHLLLRSWRYSLTHLRTLLKSLAAILTTLVLAGFIAIIMDNLLQIWFIEATTKKVPTVVEFDGLLARNYQRLLVLPICWSYQALLYQHARDQEPS